MCNGALLPAHPLRHGSAPSGCLFCRSKTQGIALSLGDKLILKQKA